MSPFQTLPVQDITDKYTWQDFRTKLMYSRLVFGRNRVTFNHCSKRYHWSVKGHSETSLIRCLPIRQEILNVSQIAVGFHGIRPPFFVQTWLQQTADVPSLILRTALSAIPLVPDLCGVDVHWFQEKSSLDLPNSRNCQCKWLLVSSSAPRTFVSSFAFPGKCLFYMGMIVSTVLPSLVPLQRIDDCFEIHILR